MPRTGHEDVHINGPSLGYIMATEVAKHLVIVRSFFLWPILALVCFLMNRFWPDNMYVLAFIGTMGVLMSVFVWYLTHTRHVLGYAHAVLTVLLVSGILAYIDAIGWTRVTVFMMIMVVPLLCLTWSIRAAIREHDALDGQHLSGLFETAGMPGASMAIHTTAATAKTPRRAALKRKKAEPVEVEGKPTSGKQRREKVDRRVKATIKMEPGGTAEDLIKSVRKIESAAGWPPGTMTATPNIDHAGKADVVLSDPRTLRKPVEWPGPSYIGGSIADPISVGLYQDGTECEVKIPETQIQVMGMVGSGKSLGGAWSTLAEIVTRTDVVVWAIDITKGMQTLGPLAPAIHRIATTSEDAMQLLADANALIKPRTEYLAKKGLGKWRKGCGLKYLVVWIEEIPDVVEALGDDGEALWIKSVKAARSAGITFAWSLQRADYSQIPTITRGQAIKWCFGVADSHEASFGLSEVQNAGDCSPELWGQRQPGMSFLDAPSISESKVCMPLRTWYWSDDDSMIKEFAAQYPASDRPYDSVMMRVLEEVEPTEPVADVAEPVEADTDEDPGEETEVEDADLDSDLEPLDGDFAFEKAKRDTMEPVEARAAVRAWLVAHAGQRVSNADLVEARKATGYGRAWGYKVMGEFESIGLVAREDTTDGIVWRVTAKVDVLSRVE